MPNRTLGTYLLELLNKNYEINFYHFKDTPNILRIRLSYEDKVYFSGISKLEFEQSILGPDKLIILHIDQMVINMERSNAI